MQGYISLTEAKHARLLFNPGGLYDPQNFRDLLHVQMYEALFCLSTMYSIPHKFTVQ